MKTHLPLTIKTVAAAKHFLAALHANGEAYHPEDNARGVVWNDIPAVDQPTRDECDRLNALMGDIYRLDAFDPCEFILGLSGRDDIRAGDVLTIRPEYLPSYDVQPPATLTAVEDERNDRVRVFGFTAVDPVHVVRTSHIASVNGRERRP